MKDTLVRIRRLREHGKRVATMALAQAEVAREHQELRIHTLKNEVTEARESTQANSVADLKQYHAYRLRMEMVERREEDQLAHERARVLKRKGEVRNAVRESDLIQALLDNRLEKERTENRRSEGRELDAMGLMAWTRNSS